MEKEYQFLVPAPVAKIKADARIALQNLDEFLEFEIKGLRQSIIDDLIGQKVGLFITIPKYSFAEANMIADDIINNKTGFSRVENEDLYYELVSLSRTNIRFYYTSLTSILLNLSTLKDEFETVMLDRDSYNAVYGRFSKSQIKES